MTEVIGWILWGLVALYFIVVLLPDFVTGGLGIAGGSARGRLLVGTQGLVILVGLVFTAAFPVSKFHLLWVVPVAFYIVPLMPVNPAYRLWRRADSERKILKQLQRGEITVDQAKSQFKEVERVP